MQSCSQVNKSVEYSRSIVLSYYSNAMLIVVVLSASVGYPKSTKREQHRLREITM